MAERHAHTTAAEPGGVETPRSHALRRVRVAEAVYQRIDRRTGQPVPGKFEFVYRDSTRHQRWQTAKGDTKADAKAERADMVARLHRGERVERSSRTVGEVAEAWLERGRVRVSDHHDQSDRTIMITRIGRS